MCIYLSFGLPRLQIAQKNTLKEAEKCVRPDILAFLKELSRMCFVLVETKSWKYIQFVDKNNENLIDILNILPKLRIFYL